MACYSGKVVAWLALAMVVAAATPCAAQNFTRDFMRLHNQARRSVGVGAVSWDDDVAAFARSYAAQRAGDCNLDHSGGGPNGYGENIFGGSGADLTASDAVGSWMEEKQWYDHGSNSCSAPQGKSCLHYTQVVWRASTAIGCARIVCNNGGVFITCNYKPAGNIRGQSPY